MLTLFRCFYINPIISLAAVCPILLIWRKRFRVRAHEKNDGPSVLKLLLGLDYLGILTIVPSVISLLLALQLGGSMFTWSDARSIASLVVAGVLFVAFLLTQHRRGDNAMLPPRIAKLRVIYVSAIYSATLDAAYLVMVYYVSASVPPAPATYDCQMSRLAWANLDSSRSGFRQLKGSLRSNLDIESSHS